MSLKAYLGKLRGSVKVEDLKQNLDMIDDKMVDLTKPILDAYGSANPTSDTIVAQTKIFERNYNETIYHTLLRAHDNILDIIAYIQKALSRDDASEFTTASIKAYHLNLLKLTDTIDFVSEYMRRFITYLVSTAHNAASGKPDHHGITPAEIKYIESNHSTFHSALKTALTPLHKIRQQLDSLPAVAVDLDSYDMLEKANSNRLDPMALGFISTRFNPILFIGLVYAKYQAERYNQAQQDLHEVQCKLLRLKQLQDDKSDPQLEKRINYYENRNKELRAKIDRLERDYGIND